MPRYYITTKTGSGSNNDTDSKVEITLNGPGSAKTSWIQLDNPSVNDFEKSKTDVFEVINDIKFDASFELLSVDIRVGTDGWFPEWVEVRRDDTGQVWVFSINRWIDGQTVKFYPATFYYYLVRVRTSDVTDAGTDSAVYITITGSKGSGKFRLDNPSDDFKRAKVEEFELRTPTNIGDVQSIQLLVDGDDAWNVEWVEVVRDPMGDNQTAGFFFNAWVRKNAPLSAARRELKDYAIATKTRHISNAATDGTVDLELVGALGRQKFRLNTAANDFETGAIDRFQVKRPDVGDIQQALVTVYGDADWAFEWIEVREMASGRVFAFSGYASNGTVLWASNSVPVTLPAVPLHPYQIRVKTGVVANAATDMKVFVKLPGAFPEFAASSGFDTRIRLDAPGRDDFGADAEDDFEIRTMLPVSLEGDIEVSVSGSGEWYAEWIDIRDLESQRNWTYRLARMIRQSDGPLRFSSVPLYDYGITVKTGDAEGSGTDSRVYLTLTGKDGQRDRFLLDKPGRNDFGRGKADKFERRSIIAPNNLAGIALEAKGAWRCDWIELREKSHSALPVAVKAWDFFVNQAFSANAAPKSFRPTQMQTYRVLVKTGNDGVDAVVEIQLQGTLGSSSFTLLDKPSRNDFLAGAVDEFMMKTASDLGEIKSISVRKKNGGSWRVDWIEVQRASDRKTWNFWLDRSFPKGFSQVDAIAPSTDVNSFVIRTMTGGIAGASSDAAVYITLSSSKTQTFMLDTVAHNDRERGAVDTYYFKTKGATFGSLSSITLQLSQGSWFVDWATVEVNGTPTIFYIYKWMKAAQSTLTCNVNVPNLPQLTAAKLDELVKKFAPLVYLHPDEQYKMCSPEWFLDRTSLVASNGSRQPASVLTQAGGVPADSQSYYLDLANSGDTTTWKGKQDSAKAYVRAKLLNGGFMDIQYWFFYAYNGEGTAYVRSMVGGGTVSEDERVSLKPLGSHMGDWEHVTMRVDLSTERLCAVYFSQHDYGQWVGNDTSIGELTLVPNVNLPGVEQVVVYASRNGHASYPKKGMNADIDIIQPPSIPSFWKAVTAYPQVQFKLRNDTNQSAYSLDCSVHYQIISADFLATPPAAPVWLGYKGKWGPVWEQNLTNARLRELLAAAVGAVAVDGVLIHLIVPVVGTLLSIGTAAFVTAAFIDPNGVISGFTPHPLYDAGGPSGPQMKPCWAGAE